jgi:hypothetical protein
VVYSVRKVGEVVLYSRSRDRNIVGLKVNEPRRFERLTLLRDIILLAGLGQPLNLP